MLAKFFLLALFIQASLGLESRFIDHLWNNFKKTHGKFYLSAEHDTKRRDIFAKNLARIEKHNDEASMGIHSYTLGVNEFADMTFEEFRQKYLGYRRNMTQVKGMNTHTFLRLSSEIKVPDSIDWREKGAVCEVKNQGECGSCWSFSTTGALEGAHFRATGELVSLSEQQLVDCSGKNGNNGCNGGLMDNAFQYVKENGGIDSEDSYPYKGVAGSCHFKKRYIAANCTGFVDIPSQDENALKEALATIGPISVAIDATQENFMLYKSGVFVDDTCSSGADELDHGVLAVGYGSLAKSSDDKKDAPKDYWIVKNSWGTTWGEQGYIRMARNLNNMCGIATQASYPLTK